MSFSGTTKCCSFTVRFCCVAEEISSSVLWDRGRVNDGDTDCPASLVAEESGLWKRRSQKESQAWLMLCWRNGVVSKAGGESLVGRLESHCITASFICNELRSQMVCMSPDDLTDLCSEGLPGFLFCKSSCLSEISTCFYKDYYWNTFPASQSLLYLLYWNQLKCLENS